MKLSQIAQSLGCELHGDGDLDISGVAGIEHAGPSHLTFLANMKYAPKLRYTHAAAILSTQPHEGLATLVSSNPYLDFARALALFYQPPKPAPGIHPLASIASTLVSAKARPSDLSR
jgi:UDP-3-O-[3-hydroxymyristoyl] glucosamine N-acyltransferase